MSSNFEKLLKAKLAKDLTPEDANKFESRFIKAKAYLEANVYDEIKGVAPQMSDHGHRHIRNVLENAFLLIGGEQSTIDGINVYCLGLAVLFHDVGNIFERSGHQKRIAEIYKKALGNEPEFAQERQLIVKIGGAHTGLASDGSTDTLKDVTEMSHIQGKPIMQRELAAVLRFADECAEGSQRTSDYLLQTNRYTEESSMYHQYGASTHLFIDMNGRRITLTYHIELDGEKMSGDWLDRFLDFVFRRIEKMDKERRYCKHYSNYLTPLEKTESTINFTADGLELKVEPIELLLRDQVPLPGDEPLKSGIIQDSKCRRIEDICTQVRHSFHEREP